MELMPEDVLTVATSVLGTMLSLEAEPAPPADGGPKADRVSGCVQISGAWQGAVVLQTSRNLATEIACRMFDLAPGDATTADLQDALAEVTNMIGGNIKSLVPGPSYLSLPSVTVGDDFDLRVFGAKVISQLTLACTGDLLDVLVCEHDPELAASRTAQRMQAAN